MAHLTILLPMMMKPLSLHQSGGAFHRILNMQPDLVLSNINITNLVATERRLRPPDWHPKTRQIPMIVCSTHMRLLDSEKQVLLEKVATAIGLPPAIVVLELALGLFTSWGHHTEVLIREVRVADVAGGIGDGNVDLPRPATPQYQQQTTKYAPQNEGVRRRIDDSMLVRTRHDWRMLNCCMAPTDGADMPHAYLFRMRCGESTNTVVRGESLFAGQRILATIARTGET